MDLRLIPPSAFRRVNEASVDDTVKLALIADMCRANTLAIVKRAGSGHLGSSFSAMDVVVQLYYRELDLTAGHDSPDRDIYFSSKGHDVPGLYSVLFSLGLLPRDRFVRLRRHGGLDGHPDVGIPWIEACSGSLGMGLSKARGVAWAKAKLGRRGKVVVMTGDGELQEGQNYEALQAAVHQRVHNLTLVVDHNQVQSDKRVSEILDLGDLAAKLRAFGWHVLRCDGHDPRALAAAFTELQQVEQPKAIIADTIKGRGVSFMEHPRALEDGNGYYRWHAGAPDDERYAAAWRELEQRIAGSLADLGLGPLETEPIDPERERFAGNALGEPVSRGAGAMKETAEYVADAFGEALLEIGARRDDVVVLDADLAADCRTRAFELRHPDRYVQNGIAEQDMVSMAGGLARHGFLPIVCSFASFLTSRANEQIYNNACEGSKIIYACHYAGLIPAGPGKSHQSLRDVSLLGALPNVAVVEPCNAEETRQLLDWCLEVAPTSAAIRLAIGPSPRRIDLGPGYRLTYGRGTPLSDGSDAILFGYGPVMLHEALGAAEICAGRGVGVRVVNIPWLNRVDADWLAATVAPYSHLFALDDHAPAGGLGDHLLDLLAAQGALTLRTFTKLAVEGFPACGTPTEALRHHHLDAESLATRIFARLR